MIYDPIIKTSGTSGPLTLSNNGSQGASRDFSGRAMAEPGQHLTNAKSGQSMTGYPQLLQPRGIVSNSTRTGMTTKPLSGSSGSPQVCAGEDLDIEDTEDCDKEIERSPCGRYIRYLFRSCISLVYICITGYLGHEK